MGRRVFAVAALFALADALSVRSRALPRVAPARRPAAAPPTMMSQTEKSNKSKLQTIVKDKIDEDTKVKEDQSLEEPWRAPGARPKAPAPKRAADRLARRRAPPSRPPPPPLRRLLLHNDDVHTFEYVTYMLQKIIPTISNAKAYQLTMTTHCEGVSTVSQTAKPLAQKYCVQLQKGGLTASISPDSNFKNNRSGGEGGDGDDGPGTE